MATDLFCCERLQPDLRKTEKDPVIFNDVRVINNLLCLEKQYVPSCDYFSTVQRDIKPFMRKIVSTWMLEVCEELGVEEQVFPLAVNYLDRFLCNCCISKRHLQLAASVCIMIASKIRQCQYVSIETLCFYADHSITPQEMKDWELLILSKLQWNVAAVTGFDYIDHIIDRVSWGMENPLIRRHASTLVGICYTDPDFIQVAPSVMATACICSAVRGLKMASSGIALKTICQLLKTINAEEVELIVDRIEAVFQAEAAIFQQQTTQTKGSGLQNVTSGSNTTAGGKEEDTVDGHPETPTDIQDVHF